MEEMIMKLAINNPTCRLSFGERLPAGDLSSLQFTHHSGAHHG